jgi:phosphoglycolate phosphatase
MWLGRPERMIKAVIIDLDDTLFMSFEAGFKTVNRLLVEMGRDSVSHETFVKFWGKPIKEAVTLWSPGVDVEAFVEEFVAFFPIAVKDGVMDLLITENLEALRLLKAKGLKLFVLTSRMYGELAHLLEPDHELSECIEKFYYKDNMRYHKPDPRAFEHIEEEHGWKPDECVYVGDSLGDAAAAKGAGLRFVASLESGLRTKNDFADYKVDAFIYKFSELPDIIKQWPAQES